MRRGLMSLVVATMFFSPALCFSQEVQGEVKKLDGEACQAMVSSLRDLLSKDMPSEGEGDRLTLMKKSFDINNVFSALAKLSVKDGYILDYAYDEEIGTPMVYARKAEDEPFVNASQVRRAKGGWLQLLGLGGKDAGQDYLRYVQTDGSPESFFQLAVLQIMGAHFYQFDHANYEDATVVCSASGLPAARTEQSGPVDYVIPPETLEAARSLDLTPTVEDQGDHVLLSIVVFSKWKGFTRVRYGFDKDTPGAMQKLGEELLLPYDCGVFF